MAIEGCGIYAFRSRTSSLDPRSHPFSTQSLKVRAEDPTLVMDVIISSSSLD